MILQQATSKQTKPFVIKHVSNSFDNETINEAIYKQVSACSSISQENILSTGLQSHQCILHLQLLKLSKCFATFIVKLNL
jgi:hypothetical protein